MVLPATFKVLGRKSIDGINHVVIEDTMEDIRKQKSVLGDAHDVVRRVNLLFPKHRIILKEKVGLTELINENGVLSGFCPFQSPKRDAFRAIHAEMVELRWAEENGMRPALFEEARKNRQGRPRNN